MWLGGKEGKSKDIWWTARGKQGSSRGVNGLGDVSRGWRQGGG